ncbi:CDPK-related protein kinase [Hordeum vulgare]|nr:CDPK-related protein kinase [Hordeum vulgare]
MWSSGRGSDSRSGGGSDPERKLRVRSDTARKRGARRWTNRGISPPASFRVRETEEYDRRQVAAGSSSAVGSSSSAALLPVKRQWSEEPEDVVAVKEEPEELGRCGVVGPEDFVADVEAVATTIAERSLHEEAERRRHDEEIKDLQWRQAVEANIAAKAKDDEWRRIREEQKTMYINLDSSDEED